MNPQTLEARACMAHWQLSHEGRALMLTRDDWSIRVLFDGSAPAKAAIRKPGSAEWQHLDRRAITTHVRGHRDQMTMFRLGDRVMVGPRYGTVTDIYVDTPTALTNRACPVKLHVLYADGESGTPYATSALRLREALA
ncbi:hypothetical protein AB0L53_47005 [Nonomuraea sp. NPDC052129]|uniref:hypothetical protein n=1 Tax=Nonomuraea sp. NPDC052129 TaxID=3154651 RepID=UPI003419A215